MPVIDPADDELYGLAAAAARLGRVHKLLARLAAACRASPADPRAARWYALAQMAALPSIGVEFAAHARFTDTTEALGQVLAIDPDDWIARYSRARLWAMAPASYGAPPTQTSMNLEHAIDDLERLIAQQAGDAPEPHFISAYALAMVVGQLAGNLAVDRRTALLTALSNHPRVPVRLSALGAVLCEPLVVLYGGCAGADRNAIGEALSALYGDQPSAVAALRRQPAG